MAVWAFVLVPLAWASFNANMADVIGIRIENTVSDNSVLHIEKFLAKRLGRFHTGEHLQCDKCKRVYSYILAHTESSCKTTATLDRT